MDTSIKVESKIVDKVNAAAINGQRNKELGLVIYYSRKVLLKLRHLQLSKMTPAFKDIESTEFAEVVSSSPKVLNISSDDLKSTGRNSLLDSLIEIAEVSVEDQTKKFLELVLLSTEEKLQMSEVCQALEEALKSQFPECQVLPFGSSASGLALKGSDLDIHVGLGPSFLFGGRSCKTKSWDDQLKTLKAFDVLKPISRFRGAYLILNARIPLIKVTDQDTGIKCDINVMTKMGVKNTEFLAYCCELDDRILPVISIVKYFCKVQGISASGKGIGLNNYTLVFMAIFFFQVQGILPSVMELQAEVESEIICGWNFAYSKDLEKWRVKDDNKQSVLKLVGQFFKFYRDYPYELEIICPLVGQSIKKSRIQFGLNLPGVMENAPDFGRSGEKLSYEKCFVVQDPFELTRNVGHAVNRDCVDHMVTSFSRALRLVNDIESGENQQVKLWMLFEADLTTYRDILCDAFLSMWSLQRKHHDESSTNVVNPDMLQNDIQVSIEKKNRKPIDVGHSSDSEVELDNAFVGFYVG